MSHYITSHGADGKAIFSKKLPTGQHEMEIPNGTVKLLWSSHDFPMDLSTEADIEQYGLDRTKRTFPGARRICPENGTATVIIDLKPGTVSPMHRTMTLDVIVVTQGEIEFQLDSGEKRTAKVGDSIVQRAAMHKWVNITPNDGWARMVAFLQVVTEPLDVGNKVLRSEWDH